MLRNACISPVKWCLAGLLLISASPAWPADPTAKSNGSSSGAKAELQAGDVDLQASRVYAFVDKTGFGHQHAVVGRFKSGSLRVANRDAGKFVFDMASFVADTAEARKYLGMQGETDGSTQREVTHNMLGRDVLDVARHPVATFEIHSMRLIREASRGTKAQYELAGTFSLHGVSQKLVVKAEGSEEKAGYLHLTGRFSMNQTNFGITPYTKAFGAVGVADGVRVYGDLWVVSDPAAIRAAARETRTRAATAR